MNLSLLDTLQTADKINQIDSFFSKEKLYSLGNDLISWAARMIGDIIIALIVWKIGKYIIKWAMKLIVKALEKSNIDTSVCKFTVSLSKVVMYACLSFAVISIIGIPTTSLLTVFGTATLTIGMSLQGSLANFAGGILLLIFRPFRLGDYIIVGSCEGTVISIEILYTKLRTIDNKIIMMPNGSLSNDNIINVGAEDNRRLDIEIGVGYQTNLSTAKKLLNTCLQNTEAIIKDKEIKVIVKSLDESCITLETRAWVSNDKFWDTKFYLLEEYKNIFDKNGIEIPFNQMDVHIINN